LESQILTFPLNIFLYLSRFRFNFDNESNKRLMSSIIEGYNYDIFISYRQKDNKHDGWVTEFVNNLKGELESTFKEEISVYFDINPHDGLLETHDVDASLKEKLKCLIFIPIISRTYCDPKSFAWEHEFKAFVEQASKDQFGLKVKIPGGNVASRVLPVQIHDLESEDRNRLEESLGGHIRGVEFIYKESGVNKPLTQADDEKKNLSKTKYNYQVNKVANAIREIISGLKNSTQNEWVAEEKINEKSFANHGKLGRGIIPMVIAASLIAVGVMLYPKTFKHAEQPEKSIAVLPFKLLSNELDKQYLADGMMDAITLHLAKVKDLRVLGRTSTEQYRNPTKTTTAIGKDLGVNYLLEGSYQKFGDSVRLIVQLLRTGKEGHVWAESYDRNSKDIFKVQSEVAQTIASSLHAAITPEEKQLINGIPTINLKAYDYYQRGMDQFQRYWLNTSDRGALAKVSTLFKNALDCDSTFALAYVGLAKVYREKYFWKTFYTDQFLDSVLILTNLAKKHNPKIYEIYLVRGDYFRNKGDDNQAIGEYNRAIELNNSSWEAYFRKAVLYWDRADNLSAIQHFIKAASLNRGRELPEILRNLSRSFYAVGFYDKEGYYQDQALKIDGDSLNSLGWQWQHKFWLGDYSGAIDLVMRYHADTINAGSVQFYMGYNYSMVGEYKKAISSFEKYLKRIKTNPEEYADFGSEHRIGYAFWMNGQKKEAEYYFNRQIENCYRIINLGRQNVKNLSPYYDLAAVYAFKGDREKAYENLNIWFTGSGDFKNTYDITLITTDPLFSAIRNEAEFQKITKEVKSKYEANRERVRKWLEDNGELTKSN
jgi:TolB-like protein/Tfp pilus assembly protein PilF